jgi:phospholipase/carboxylesterase
MNRILSGPEIKPANGGGPKKIMLLLHGVGANGDNLISLANFFQEDFPDMLFIAPNGPEKFSEGFGGYQWFTYWERSHAQIVQGVEQASAILQSYINQLQDEFELKAEDIILLGFSQGAMTAIQAGLTTQDNCAAILAFSGGIIKVDMNNFEVRSNPPVCLIHGQDDEVVPCSMSQISSDILSNLNVENECHIIPNLQHSIDISGINIAKDFLNRVF